MKNTISDCAVYCYLHQLEKISAGQQKEIAKKMLEYGFYEFFGEKFLWENVTRGEYGKPQYALGQFFNISHCHDGVAVALAGTPVGVDIEGSRRVKALTVRKCMDEEEKAYISHMEGDWLGAEQMRRFFHLWTLKESYVKMTGEGIRMPLNQICFSLEGEPEGFAEERGEERNLLYADNRVSAPWQKSSVSCLLPVPGHSLALTLGWKEDLPPRITYSFFDAAPEVQSGCIKESQCSRESEWIESPSQV